MLKRILCFVIYCVGIDWVCKKYLNFSPIEEFKKAANKAKNS